MDQTLAAVEQLDKSTKALNNSIKAVITGFRLSRNIIFLLIATVAIDVVLTGSTVALGLINYDTNHKVKSCTDQAHGKCAKENLKTSVELLKEQDLLQKANIVCGKDPTVVTLTQIENCAKIKTEGQTPLLDGKPLP